MEQSILKSTKKILNIGVDDPSFDLDIVTHINSAFSHLHQLGIGPEAGFAVEDETTEWTAFFSEHATPLYIVSAVKTNVYLRVRAIFDPPQLPHVLSAMQAQLLESDVRLSNMREATEWSDPDPVGIPDSSVYADPIVLDGGDA